LRDASELVALPVESEATQAKEPTAGDLSARLTQALMLMLF
jgi:hypothetical protein